MEEGSPNQTLRSYIPRDTMFKFDEIITVQEELATDLRMNQTKLDHAEKQLTERNQLVASLQASLRDQNAIVSMLRNELAKERTASTEIQNKMKQQADMVQNNLEQEIASLKKSLEECESSGNLFSKANGEQKHKIDLLHEQLKQASTDVQNSTKESEKLKALLDQKEIQIKKLTAEKNEEERTRRQLEDKLRHSEISAQTNQTQYSQEKQDWDNRSEIMLEQIHNALAAQTQAINEKEALKAQYSQQAADWKVEKVKYETLIEKLRETIERTTAETESARTGQANSQQLTEKHKNDLETWKTKALDSENENRRLKDEKNEAVQKLKTCQETLSSTQNNLTQTEITLGTTQEELVRCQSALREAENTIDSLNSKVSVTTRSSTTENRVLLLKVQNLEEKYKSDISLRDELVSRLRSEVDRIKDESSTTITRLQKSLREKEQDMEDAKRDNSRLVETISELEARIEIYDQELHALDDSQYMIQEDVHQESEEPTQSPVSPEQNNLEHTPHTPSSSTPSQQSRQDRDAMNSEAPPTRLNVHQTPIVKSNHVTVADTIRTSRTTHSFVVPSATLRSATQRDRGNMTPRIRKVVQLRAERDKFSEDSMNWHERAMELSGALKETELALKRKEEELQKVQKMSDVERKVNQSEVIDLRRKNDKLFKENAEMDKLLKECERIIQTLTKERDQLKERQKEIDSEFGDLKRERDALQQLQVELSGLKSTMEFEGTSRAGRTTSIADINKELEDRVSNLQLKLDEREIELIQITAERDGRIVALQTSLNSQTIILEQIQAELQDEKEEKEKLLRELRKIRRDETISSKQNEQSEKDNEELRRTLTRLKLEKETIEKKMETMIVEMGILKEQKDLREKEARIDRRKKETEIQALEATLERRSNEMGLSQVGTGLHTAERGEKYNTFQSRAQTLRTFIETPNRLPERGVDAREMLTDNRVGTARRSGQSSTPSEIPRARAGTMLGTVRMIQPMQSAVATPSVLTHTTPRRWGVGEHRTTPHRKVVFDINQETGADEGEINEAMKRLQSKVLMSSTKHNK
ncbi:hypothetical protein BLNAU_3127 [Blattamonas nauphoetae]|uniref:Uncharacterized protein n=1 Tax=Blattamonas nauphoetae TaxID=2049346 RepID=A0ABQ9YE52_9EUKA|nr:hypothetical protein BLNAU_3127 [Blattamonas nauphoetae]